jgi:predicted nucleotidyltransferase
MSTRTVEMDIEKVKAYLREKESAGRQRQREEFIRTTKKIKTLAPTWNKYHITKVFLYGSITREKIHQQSDIDMAVEGDIDYRQLLELYGEVDRHFPREIDIRILEELPFKEAVKEKGVLVYEK